MKEENFGLSGQANPEGLKESREKHPGKPKSATEQKEQEGGFKARYNELSREYGLIKQTEEATFAIGHLQAQGLQTLLNEYGSDAVFDTIKKQLIDSKSKGDTFSTLEVVKALEADPKKRTTLFKKMKIDAKQQDEKIAQRVSNYNPNEVYSNYLAGIFGSQFYRNAELSIDNMKSLDSILGRILPKNYDLLSGFMRDFALRVSQFEEKEQELKLQFAEANQDVDQLVNNRDKNCKQRTELLRPQAEKLYEEVKKEVERITNEENIKFEEWRAKIISDLSKVANLETASKEMKSGLQEVLEKVENEIAERLKQTKKEIAEETKPLQGMMGGIEHYFAE